MVVERKCRDGVTSSKMKRVSAGDGRDYCREVRLVFETLCKGMSSLSHCLSALDTIFMVCRCRLIVFHTISNAPL